MRWLWVSLPHGTFGIGFLNGEVVEAAPMAMWTMGKTEAWVVQHYRRQGAHLAGLVI